MATMTANMSRHVLDHTDDRHRHLLKHLDSASLLYITDGLLLQKLIFDPELDGIDTVVLDEFHERSVNLDLALALLLQCQEYFREDLKIVLMSATLDAQDLAASLAAFQHAPSTLKIDAVAQERLQRPQ